MDDRKFVITAFQDELGKLDSLVAEMGGLAEAQLSSAIQGLVRYDVDLAEDVIRNDDRVDALEDEIDAFTVRLLGASHPGDRDLRIIIAALKIASNLERIGDYAKNVAKRTMTLAQEPIMGTSANTIARMGGVVQGMINNALDAYVSRDVDRAIDVRERDHEVDHIYTSLFRELLTYMMEEPRNITTCTHLLFVAKNVERIGDHATSIAEQVHFIVRGELPQAERPKGDGSSFTIVRPGVSDKELP